MITTNIQFKIFKRLIIRFPGFILWALKGSYDERSELETKRTLQLSIDVRVSSHYVCSFVFANQGAHAV